MLVDVPARWSRLVNARVRRSVEYMGVDVWPKGFCSHGELDGIQREIYVRVVEWMEWKLSHGFATMMKEAREKRLKDVNHNIEEANT